MKRVVYGLVLKACGLKLSLEAWILNVKIEQFKILRFNEFNFKASRQDFKPQALSARPSTALI